MKLCGATTRSGGTCRNRAGWGTTHFDSGHCRKHGGNTPNGQQHAAKEAAVELAKVYGMPVEVSHHDALEQELWRAAGIVSWLSAQVGDLDLGDAYGPVGGGEFSEPRQEPHVWINLLGQERDRLARVIRLCHDVGMDERRVRVAEQLGGVLASVIGGVLEDFGLSDDPRAPAIVRKRLAELQPPDIEGRAA